MQPVELIDLVIQEQMRSDRPAIRRRYKENAKTGVDDLTKIEVQTEDISGDEERLRARKVWSRWGKWSDCSATCGGGMIVRRRLCVAGRCAPGELEEQRRPCAESPCTTTSFELGPEDMREVE
ncbi:PREDICTED: thrombospondin-1-like [Papilio xuthus]|uniref:Thrombospondin-1-like n=1 Tax=Papilio xuthus TaxID=66420 RepID=A0AAJ6YZH3_PAPXU|nr:PREDICTED: thrombospondin-1-like [Papilio xuthus]